MSLLLKKFHLSGLVLAAIAAGCFSSALSAQSFTITYVLGQNGNTIPIGNGGTITFASTLVNSSSSATVQIVNTGTATGKVTGVAAPSSSYTIGNLSALPIQLDPGAKTTFSVNFSPTSRGSFAANLKIDFDTSPSVNISLSGQGIGPSFIVEQVTGSTTTPVGAGGIVFPDTPVNPSQPSTLRIQVRNVGETAGPLNSAPTSVGAGFAVSDLPPTPTSLTPNGTPYLFTVGFNPTTVGNLTGRLFIDTLVVNLSGKSLGPSYSFSFAVSGVTTPISAGGTLIFPNTTVGAKTSGQLTITNNGNVAGSITSASVTAPLSINPVTFPVTLVPGDSLNLGIVFAPTSAVTVTGTLSINNITFGVQGTGVTPQAIPNYTFSGVNSTSPPLQQPAISLKLASPYPQDLTGKLNLTFTSNSFVDDPSIQFASGGRTVSFTIPANTTNAIFGTSATSVQFQTGSVAGTITVTPSFAIGGVDLTPPQPLVQTVAIAPAAPTLLKVARGITTATSFELLVTGYSTPRTVTGMTLNFTQTAGKSLQTTALSIDVSTAFNSWYQSATSSTSGSQFTASVIINVNGDSTAVQSVSVTASNSTGASAPVTVSLQ